MDYRSGRLPNGITSVAYVLCYPNTVTGSCRTLTCFPFNPAPHRLCTPESVCRRAPSFSSILSIYSTLNMSCQGCQEASNPYNFADFGSFEYSELIVDSLNISLFKKCVSYGKECEVRGVILFAEMCEFDYWRIWI